jgi:hypothetical protein
MLAVLGLILELRIDCPAASQEDSVDGMIGE